MLRRSGQHRPRLREESFHFTHSNKIDAGGCNGNMIKEVVSGELHTNANYEISICTPFEMVHSRIAISFPPAQ